MNKFPELKSSDFPINLINFQYPPNFVSNFKSNPINEIQKLKEIDEYSFLSHDFNLCRFLFYCPGISYHSITDFFLSDIKTAPSLFYFYFSSFNLDYMDFMDSARMLLSRVAFPEKVDLICIIIHAFVNAYCNANQYMNKKKKVLVNILRAILLFSMKKYGNIAMPEQEFLNFLNNTHISNEEKSAILKNITKAPIPLFFTFLGEDALPNMQMTGFLSKNENKLSNKHDYFCTLLQYQLHYYKSKDLSELAGVIPIENTIVTFVPKEKKTKAHLVIKRVDGTPFGYSLKKDKKKMSTKTQHIFFASSEEEIKSWTDSLNYASIYSSIYKQPFLI